MKPIGHYAGFLSKANQEAITKASYIQLVDAMSEVNSSLVNDTPFHQLDIDDFWYTEQSENPRNKLALIRGLCDQIEQRLMEEPK